MRFALLTLLAIMSFSYVLCFLTLKGIKNIVNFSISEFDFCLQNVRRNAIPSVLHAVYSKRKKGRPLFEKRDNEGIYETDN